MIKICSVEVLENPCNFLQPFQFKITFNADEDVKENDYEWKIVYVGSPESKDFDQILLSESLGSYSKGQHDLILRSAPVNPDKIPKEELLEPSAVLLVGYYNHKQFFQVGYLVSKEYLDDTEAEDVVIEYDKLQRRIANFSRIISDDKTIEDSNNTSEFAHDSVLAIQSENLGIFCDLLKTTSFVCPSE